MNGHRIAEQAFVQDPCSLKFYARHFINKRPDIRSQLLQWLGKWDGHTLRIGSACTGTNWWSVGLRVILDELRLGHNVTINIEEVFVCEKDPVAIKWLMAAKAAGLTL
jgi:hypothetical protein